MASNDAAPTGNDQPSQGERPSVFRPNSVSYLRIPAVNPRRSADFYHAVFGWQLRGDPDQPNFTDGSGHVIGSWQEDLPIAGEAGVIPYIYVDSVDETRERVSAHAGAVMREPYPEGDLWVATFRDPAGNVIGVWQQGPRS